MSHTSDPSDVPPPRKMRPAAGGAAKAGGKLGGKAAGKAGGPRGLRKGAAAGKDPAAPQDPAGPARPAGKAGPAGPRKRLAAQVAALLAASQGAERAAGPRKRPAAGGKPGPGKATLRRKAALRSETETPPAAPSHPAVPSPASLPEGATPPLPGAEAAAAGAALPARSTAQALSGPATDVPARVAARLPSAGRLASMPARPAERSLSGAQRIEDAVEGSLSLPPARIERRHRGVIWAFALVVVLPLLAVGGYLGTMARDQYASNVAFSVRKEESTSSLDIMGGITQLAGSSTSDSDILYEFIRSQDMVARVNARVNLRAMWSRAWPADPVFAFNPAGTIEDLHSHWLRMVKLSYDAGTGIITLRVTAFDAADAQAIATALHAEANTLINALSEEARADATRHAGAERDRAMERLTSARQALTSFRLRTQIVDINSDLQGQMGLLTTLQAQLAEVLIELDLLREGAQPGDPRIRQAERRIEVIETRIAAERAKFGEGGQGPGGEDYARIAAEFERLTVEREFAEATFRAAQSGYEGAVSDAQRQSRYLAAHIRPTLAEQAQYPQRLTIFGLTGFFLLVFWGLGVLVYYSIRDRR